MIRYLVSFLLVICIAVPAVAQVGTDIKIEYSNPKDYEIAAITVSGTQYLDKKVLILLSGLTVGAKVPIPGELITKAIHNLWDQGLFSDVRINATKIDGDKIYLNIYLQEKPRLSKFAIKGVNKSDANDIREKINLAKGKVVTDNLLVTTKNIIKDFYIEKGFYNAEIRIDSKADSTQPNTVVLDVRIAKKRKVRIKRLMIHGNEQVKSGKLKRSMKETKQVQWWRVWKASKFIKSNYVDDKKALMDKYNQMGFRDARIVSDSVYTNRDGSLSIEIWIDEGRKYYFRNIAWVGNTKYTADELSKVLSIKRGEVYDQSKLEANLLMNPNGRDVSSLYLDDGYLFFNVDPVEVRVENDSIDLEMRIREGRQATINRVTVVGNTKTSDHVILREIRTKPGQLFSRSDIIRSQRELSQLGYFNSESLGVNPKPNPADGTVDIEYTVEEKPSDQVELSGGWGNGQIVGTIGVSFNNFSGRNMFKKGAWKPLPSGDGQKLSVRAQSNGLYYQSYNASFTEPWFGGKKPNSLSFSVYHSVQSNGQPSTSETRSSIMITGATIGLGRRLKFPDDYFILQNEINYQNYNLSNYTLTGAFNNGTSNTFSLGTTISRNSIGDPIFPTYGSIISLSCELTPPFSLFRSIDYSTATPAQKYQWIEYHKWKLDMKWFVSLAKNLVVMAKGQYGFLGLYNHQVGLSPFERFFVGGDGLSGFGLDGREIIALRGYDNNSLSSASGSTIFSKYVMEIRYRISANPQATIFVLGFAEAGNAWNKFSEFEPFGLKKSAGVGVRLFLPMFGLLGLDYGWRFDDVQGRPDMAPSQFHFSIGQQF